MSNPNIDQSIVLVNQAATLLGTANSDYDTLTGNAKVLADQNLSLTTQHQADQDTINQLNDALSAQGQLLPAAMLDVVTGRKPMIVQSGLHKLAIKTTDSIEVADTWIDSGGHTAQSNPTTSKISHGFFTGKVGTDTTPMRVDFSPGGGYDDLYLYTTRPLPVALPNYYVNGRVYSTNTNDRAKINCYEWQEQITWNELTYNMAWQWHGVKKILSYFNHIIKDWIPAPMVPWFDILATPVPIMGEFILDEVKGLTTHVALTVNGTRFPVNITQKATPSPGAKNKYTISICQIDANGLGNPVGLNIHNCSARYI